MRKSGEQPSEGPGSGWTEFNPAQSDLHFAPGSRHCAVYPLAALVIEPPARYIHFGLRGSACHPRGDPAGQASVAVRSSNDSPTFHGDLLLAISR